MWENLLEQVPLWSLGVYVVLIAIELTLEFAEKRHEYALNDSLCSLSTGVVYVTIRTMMRGFMLGLLMLAYHFSPLKIESNWFTFVLCYVVVDFLVYWYHRSVHEVRIGWAAHVVHHSSRKFNLGATAFRQSFAEPFIEPWFFVPAALMGFDPIMTLFALETNLIYMFWVHMRRVKKLPPVIEYFFSTPSHHRVHHANNVQYLDKNYGGTFIIWDRMLGTFAEEKEEPVFGILQQLDTHNPVEASLHGWKDLFRDVWHAKGLRNKIGYMFMPPGWAPDGQGMTTRERQSSKASPGMAE
ncbi:sterol desaturase family protein [Hyphomonas sp.]|uniref:sterol desaturase family protein n=1 Tax=Hyphomonas sp. TaxID=87 RepID=UPI003528A746